MPIMTSVQKHPKSGMWRVRRAIPEAAKFAFDGKREYLKSLGTKDHREAQSLAYPILAEVQRRIDKAIAGVLYETDEETCSAAHAFIEWDGENGGAGFFPHDPSPYIFDDREHFLNRLKEYCVECGIPTDGNALGEMEDIIESEVDHLYEISASPKRTDKTPAPHAPASSGVHDDITEQITLSQLCERLIEHKPNYIGKTERDARRAYAEMIELHGDLLLTDVKRSHVREYRDVLLRMPVKGRTKEVKEMALREVIKTKWDHTVSRDTVMKQLGYISQGFILAVSEDWAHKNPRDGLIIPVTPTSNSVGRREFRPQELEKAFASPLFNKCDGNRKEAKTGSVEIRDYRYWLPLVALYSGARLGELCQLEKSNLRQDGNVWFLEVTTVPDDETVVDKSTKTEGSVRNIPLHHVLIEKGFIAYAQAGTKPHIFTSKYDSQQKLAHEYSKWFGRYLDRIGLDIPGVVYHSFRHNFISACRKANIIKEVHESFTGHKPQDVGGKYGRHERLMDFLKAEIDRVEYEELKGVGSMAQETADQEQLKLIASFMETLKGGGNVSPRKLAKVLSDQELQEIEETWQSRKDCKDDIATRPAELDRYIKLLSAADRTSGYFNKFEEKHRGDLAVRSAVKKMSNQVDKAYEKALVCLQETLGQHPVMAAHLDRAVSFDIAKEPVISAEGMPRWNGSESFHAQGGLMDVGTKLDVKREALERKLSELRGDVDSESEASSGESLKERLARLKRKGLM